jgi:hypothetical protein
MSSANTSRGLTTLLCVGLLASCTGLIDANDPGNAATGAAPGIAGMSASGTPAGGAPAATGPGAANPGGAAAMPGGSPANPPGGPGTASAACAPTPRRLWLLTPAEYAATMATLASGLGDAGAELRTSFGGSESFLNEPGRLRLSVPHMGALYTVAKRLAAGIAATPANLDACLTRTPTDRACLRAALDRFGARAFRRPLATAELDGYLAHHDALLVGSTDRVALQQTVQTILMSPHFLFRTELGPEGAPAGAVAMTAHEKASSLAYLLTNGPPDAELTAAAGQGALATPAQIEAQARRLLARPEIALGVFTLFRERFRLEQVLSMTKDTKAFPEYTPALTADLARETSGFIEEVLWRGDGRWASLLSAPFSSLNDRLAKLYGIAGVTGAQFRKMDLPAERAGLLLQGNLLSVFATEHDSDVIRRGRFVREAILCGRVPDPPGNVNAVFPASDGKSTQRERLAVHRADPSCASCHSLLDPLGLPLETFDAAGKYRTTEAGRPIDTTSTLNGLRGGDIPIRNARHYVETLAAAPESGDCLLSAVGQYAGAVPADVGGQCIPRDLSAAFSQSGGDIREALVRLASGPNFFIRN